MTNLRVIRAVVVVASAALGGPSLGAAELRGELPPDPAKTSALPPASPAESVRAARQADLDAISRQIVLSEDRQNGLKVEIDALDKDRATLNQSLISAGENAKRLERQLDQTEQRIGGLTGDETRIRQSLTGRRAVLTEVLAGLQRIGQRPPPAMVVRPEDALAAVRSAILLGAVVPDLRIEADALSADLRELVSLRSEMAKERDRLKQDATSLAEDRRRIELLIEEKRKERDASELALADQQRRSQELAGEATTLKDLIARIERDNDAAARAAEAARRAEETRQAATKGKEKPSNPPRSLGATDRIAPLVAFAEAKGLLPRPVNGLVLKGFGEEDGLGGKTQGSSIGTRSGARVNTPADGWVVFAGTFRSYGKLLIINGGGGYHVLLAGLERIDVELGQFVLAGEPVGVMGDHRLASAGAAEIGVGQPVLYVEFRKDGNAIDPGPWWARTNDEKVGG